MKSGRVILKNKEVLAHLGQLYNLRHSLKMSSGLLDTPDYYWDRKNLEQLYERTTTNLSINRRMQVRHVRWRIKVGKIVWLVIGGKLSRPLLLGI